MTVRNVCCVLQFFVLNACATETVNNRSPDNAQRPPARTATNKSAAAQMPTWTVSQAVASIGVAQGAAEYELHQVAGGLIDQALRIVFANQGTGEIRFYSLDGQFLKSVGRKGDGPSEYRSPRLLPSFAGDSLVVFDEALQRISILDAEGTYVRSFSLSKPQPSGMLARGRALGRFANGDILIQESAAYTPTEAGLGRPPASLVGYSSDGRQQRLLGTFRGDAVYHTLYQGRSIYSKLPFLPRLLVAVAADHAYVFEGPELEITAVRPGGMEIKKTFPHVPRTVARNTYDTWAEGMLSRVPPAALAETRRFYEGLYHPWVQPAVGKLIVDDAGNLWTYGSSADSTVHWQVIDPDLTQIANVVSPATFIILAVQGNTALGFAYDVDLGFERLEIRKILK